ncbi:hypothetical protein PT974_03231 [Cladobotryum mycophilum]|uniref:Heterokaryon incompatibility domain-containing protein n=1 Tax=Cladobotryum mycophilum TaxID=491253 RepID=A0ABR0SSY3_9HYPO
MAEASEKQEEDSSLVVKAISATFNAIGVGQEKLRATITSKLVPEYKPSFYEKRNDGNVAEIQDIELLGLSELPKGQSLFRMIDIDTLNLVDYPDSSAPYCMLSHRWKDPEILLGHLHDAKKIYPDLTHVEAVMEWCKKNVRDKSKEINTCANKLSGCAGLSKGGCYVHALLQKHFIGKNILKSLGKTNAKREEATINFQFAQMESKIFGGLISKMTDDIGGNAGQTLSNDQSEGHTMINESLKEAQEDLNNAENEVFDAELEKEEALSDVQFFDEHKELRDKVDGLVSCLRLWRSAVKIEKSILKAKEIFDRDQELSRKNQKRYVWLDTCCINKLNHGELSESLSLMGDWYAQSTFTLVHLDNPENEGDIVDHWIEFLPPDERLEKIGDTSYKTRSPIKSYDTILENEIEWSTRGWTLQELVMSKMTYYVNSDWESLTRPVERLGRVYHLIPYIDIYIRPFDLHPPADNSELQSLNALLLKPGTIPWSQAMAMQFPPINQGPPSEQVANALRLIKALESIGFQFPNDMALETAKFEMARAVFFATKGIFDSFEKTQNSTKGQNSQENGNNRLFGVTGAQPHAGDNQAPPETGKQQHPANKSQQSQGSKSQKEPESEDNKRAVFWKKRELERAIERAKKNSFFLELHDCFPKLQDLYPINTDQTPEEKTKAISKTFQYMLSLLVREAKTPVEADREYIAKFGKVELLGSWIKGTQRHGFTAQEVMALSCSRAITKSVDRAYSLMGILGVRFETFNAEGSVKALCRLLDQVVITHNDVSVFNWTGCDKGCMIRGRSMYPSSHEAYTNEEDRSRRNNLVLSAKVRDEVKAITDSYFNIMSLLRQAIKLIKTRRAQREQLEWIEYIATIAGQLSLKQIRSCVTIERVDSSETVEENLLDYQIRMIQTMIQYAMAYGKKTSKLDTMPSYDENKRAINNTNSTSNPSLANTNPSPVSYDDAGFTSDSDVRTVEPASPSLSTAPTLVEHPEKLPASGKAPDRNDYVSRWLKELANGSMNTEEYHSFYNFLQEQNLPTEIRTDEFKDQKQAKTSDLGTSDHEPPSMISPHPIIVTNAGIEGFFDIQRVVITMQNLEGLRQQVEHVISPEQRISGWCSISTGFAQVVVQFTCRSDLLKKQLEVTDGIAFRVTKEQEKGEGKKREQRLNKAMTALFKSKKKDKKHQKADHTSTKTRKPASSAVPETTDQETSVGSGDTNQNKTSTKRRLRGDSGVAMNNDSETENGPGTEPNGGIKYNIMIDMKQSEESEQDNTDEEKTVERIINFIQEDDLRLIAGEWVLARCSGVAGAKWFLCLLELGSTHPFYGHRIASSEIDFANCTPEPGLVKAWETYMTRKNQQMCNILWWYCKAMKTKLKMAENRQKELDISPASNSTTPEMTENRTMKNVSTEQVRHAEAPDSYGNGLLKEEGEEMKGNGLLKEEGEETNDEPKPPNDDDEGDNSDREDKGESDELNLDLPGQDPMLDTEATGDWTSFLAKLRIVDKLLEMWGDHLDRHLDATALKGTPRNLRAAIENLNDDKDFLPSMFQSTNIHMF